MDTPFPTLNCTAFVTYSGARVVLDQWYVTGQPSAAAYPAIAQAGIGSVICLRDPDETNPQPPPVPPVPPFDTQEAATLAALGVTYLNVVITRTMTQAQFDEAATEAALRLLQDGASKPALIHCSTGDRASSVFAALLIGLDLLSHDRAVQYAENSLLLANSSMIELVQGYRVPGGQVAALRAAGTSFRR